MSEGPPLKYEVRHLLTSPLTWAVKKIGRPAHIGNIKLIHINPGQINNFHGGPYLLHQCVARWGKARAGLLTLPHGTIETPVFMPVGTQGTVKGVTSQQLEELGCKIILGNTYHLGHRPGPDVLSSLGGLHKFMNWNNNLLTDSGGFQMVSLLRLANITEVRSCIVNHAHCLTSSSGRCTIYFST